MKLSKHFSDYEFFCKCCNQGTPLESLLKLLENIRFEIEKKYGYVKIVITGPLRCDKHNEEIKGSAKESRHRFKYSDGVDIKCYIKDVDNNWIQLNPLEVGNMFNRMYPNSFGMGIYHNRNHVDSRPGAKKRWTG